ncbi:MAG: MFS transporter [Thermomicrobium sp.]|nr:MFS transporter [Thermomicrobium sp.]
MTRHRRDHGYAWAIVGVLALTETVSWGVLYYGFPVFLVPMERELGWSRASLTGAFSLALLLAGITAPLVGRVLDRSGPRLPMTAGSLLATVLVLAWSRTDHVLLLYVVWAGLGFAMALVLYDAAFTTVARWFERRRRQALTVLTLVGGFASVIFTPLTTWLVETLGWRRALVVLAALLFVATVVPHAVVLRAPPADDSSLDHPRPTAHVARLVSSATFWSLTLALTLAAFVTVAVTVHLLPYLLGRGFAPGFAATATGLIGLLQIPGRLLVVPLGQRVPDRISTPAVFLLQGGSALLLLWAAGHPIGVLCFVALFGMANGMITILRAARPAELFGSAAYGTVIGTMTLPVTLARALAPLGTGALYSLVGRDAVVWWGVVLVGCAAALAALVAETTAQPGHRGTVSSSESQQLFPSEEATASPQDSQGRGPHDETTDECEAPIEREKTAPLSEQDPDQR